MKRSEFDFESDLAFGEQSEEFVKSCLASLASGSFEVKTDRYRNGRMVVETQQNPHGILNSVGERKWVDSGINVTTAKWWVYVFAKNDSVLIVSVERLRRYLRMNKNKFNNDTKKFFAASSDNPAKGFLLMKDDVVEMMTNEKYD